MPPNDDLQPPVPILVNERQAAALLGGLTVRTMFNLRKQGLPFVRIGSRVLYRPRDLEGWVRGQKGDRNAEPS